MAVAGRVTAAAAKGALKRGTDGARDEGEEVDGLAALKSRAGERYRAVCGTRAVTDDDTAAAAAAAGVGVGVDAGAAEGAGVGELLVSCSDDFTLFLWSPATDKKPLVRLTGHQQAVNHIAFSPGTSCGLQNAPVVLVPRPLQLTPSSLPWCFTRRPSSVASMPDGRFFASASFDKKVKLWCGKTGRFLSTLSGHVGSVYQGAPALLAC